MTKEQKKRIKEMEKEEFGKFLIRTFLELKEEFRIRALRKRNNFKLPRKVRTHESKFDERVYLEEEDLP